MIKALFKEGLYAFRRTRYNRKVEGHPTTYGRMWQEHACKEARSNMCKFFGVKSEKELTQEAIDNYTSTKLGTTLWENIIKAQVSTMMETMAQQMGLKRKPLSPLIEATESHKLPKRAYGDNVGYIPIKVGDFKTVVGVADIHTLPRVPTYHHKLGMFTAPIKDFTVPELDEEYCKYSRGPIKNSDDDYYASIMAVCQRFWCNLFKEYFSQYIADYNMDDFKILVSPYLIEELTGHLPDTNSVFELIIEDGRFVNTLNHIQLNSIGHEELKRHLHEHHHNYIVSKIHE